MEITINNTGGTVVLNDGCPPPSKRQWIKRWHVFGLTLALSNGRIKRRPERDLRYKEGDTQRKMCEIKGHIYQRNGGCCPMCHQPMELRGMELHHILPWGRFPELRMKADNLELLCHHCHKEIHINPWLNIKMMQQKAQQLGIDLKERYDTN